VQCAEGRLAVHGVGLVEHVAEVGEQTGAERGLGVVLRIERDRGFPGPGGPVAVGEIGDGDERFPRVRGAVLDGHIRLNVAQLVEVGACPGAAPTAEVSQRLAVAAVAVTCDRLAGRKAAHRDHYRPVGDGVGQAADSGERGHGEGGQRSVSRLLMSHRTYGRSRECPALRMPRKSSSWSAAFGPNTVSASSSRSVGGSSPTERTSAAAFSMPGRFLLAALTARSGGYDWLLLDFDGSMPGMLSC
jgi:hypothetical protein